MKWLITYIDVILQVVLHRAFIFFKFIQMKTPTFDPETKNYNNNKNKKEKCVYLRPRKLPKYDYFV